MSNTKPELTEIEFEKLTRISHVVYELIELIANKINKGNNDLWESNVYSCPDFLLSVSYSAHHITRVCYLTINNIKFTFWCEVPGDLCINIAREKDKNQELFYFWRKDNYFNINLGIEMSNKLIEIVEKYLEISY